MCRDNGILQVVASFTCCASMGMEKERKKERRGGGVEIILVNT
jgi:hypothetical protein